MSRHPKGLQDQAQEMLVRSAQVHRLLECVAPQAEDNPHLQDAIEGVVVLAGQVSEMAEALLDEVTKPTAHELAGVMRVMANAATGVKPS